MNTESIVAVFDDTVHADAAIAELTAANVPASDITRHWDAPAGAAASPKREQGFWSSLFGGDTNRDSEIYDRSMQAGSSVVVVQTSKEEASRIMDILDRHDPVDMEERAATYGMGSTTGVSASPTAIGTSAFSQSGVGATGDKLELTEENLAVGKRAINQGTTRIRRYVVETPVEESVTLHNEKVTLERQPVAGRPVTDPDFSPKTIEMTETAEEVVVAKTARVVEEVGLRKEASDRVETVRDTVRKDEVEIEQIPGGQTSGVGAAAPLKPVPTAKPI